MSSKLSRRMIDVVVPCYNCESFIPGLFEKLSKQTCQDFNLILADDASTDSSVEVAKECGARFFDGRFLLLQHKFNKGPGAARNTGVRKAVSDYIWFFDCDDLPFRDNVIQEVKNLLEVENGDLDCICLGYTAEKKNGVKKVQEPNSLKAIGGYACWATAAWAKVIKRKLVVDFPEGVLVEDVPWWFKQADNFDPAKVGLIPQSCVWYNNLNPGSSSRTAEYLYTHYINLETLACSDILEKRGLNDRWVLDYIKNLANLYALKHTLKHENVKAAWKLRFHQNYLNLVNGSYLT